MSISALLNRAQNIHDRVSKTELQNSKLECKARSGHCVLIIERD